MKIDICFADPKPNKKFSELERATTKFITYSKPVPCAYCGRNSKSHWTQLKFFRIMEGFETKLANGKVVESNAFQLTEGKELFPPLTPVCTKHILKPEMEVA